MSKRSSLLKSIAGTIKDYREGEISEPTPEHVDRWIKQFEQDAQVPLLLEIDYVLKKTYFSKANFIDFFSHLIKHKELTGDQLCDFWRAAHLLNIQQNGHSQEEILELFAEALKEQCDLKVEDCSSDGGAFIYLDDILFSGGRIGSDLSDWIKTEAPKKATVYILVIATHQLGEWQCTERLKKAAAAAGKELNFNCWAAIRFENRKKYCFKSEVLWPAEIPEDSALKAYMAGEEKFPFEPRKPGGKLEHAIFSSEEGRQLLEREMLLAGMQIRSFSQNPSPALRPLGFSAFGLGFGSMIVTFRNCPNNSPLALWWGDPTAASSHPFSKWYPLLPRKTYPKEVDLDDIYF